VYPSLHLTKAIMRSSNTVVKPADGDGEGLTEAEGLGLADGDGEAEGLNEGDGDSPVEGLGE
jgi:hypothetical protein